MPIEKELDIMELSLKTLRRLEKEQSKENYILIGELVKLHQFYRLNKEYKISDQLRDIANRAGIKIIEGTAKYGTYDNIPENMRNNTWNDTWRRI